MSNHDKEFLIRVKADIKQATDNLNAVAGNLKDVGTSGSSAGSAAAGGMDKATKATMTWHQFIKERMGPLMKQFAAEGKSHAESHTLAIRKIAAEWKQYKATGVKANTAVNESTQKSTKLLGQLKTALVAYISFRGAKAIIQQADAFNVLQQRIKTATKNTGDHVQVSRELYNISQKNGAELEVSVALFQGLARSAPELQATNAEMLKLTNLVEQLGVISGASKANSRAGLLQFSQGLAAGVFRAEEFNSLLENLPELANRMAKGMGKTTGELREAVKNGEVLSKEVFDALIKQAPEIAAEFKDIPVSVERAATQLSTSFVKVLSQLDQATGLTKAIAEGMQAISRSLDGSPGNVRDLAAELAKLEVKLDSIGSKTKRSARSREPSRSLLENRISEIKQQINDSLIAEGGPVGIRLAIDKAEQVITNTEERIEKLTNSNNRRARSRLGDMRAQLNAQKLEREALLKSLADVELADTSKDETKTENKNKEKIESVTAALKQQSETFGQTSEEIALYKLQLLGADEAQLKLVDSFITSIKQQKEAIKVQEAVKRIFEETRTESEKLASELDNLDQLLASGKLNWDTYSRAVFNANEKYEKVAETGSDAMKQLEAATRGWGDQFTNTLADMVQTNKLEFKSLVDSIISDLLRIQIMQNITKPLFGALGIPGFAVGTNHTGGMAGTGAAKYVNPAVFLNAPRYHTGGIVGLKANEVPAILQKNEEVLTRDDPRHAFNQQGGSNTVKVEIVKNGSPVQTQKAETSFNPEGMVVKVFLDDMNRGGPISNRLDSKIRNR